jgi:hypothetical protein
MSYGAYVLLGLVALIVLGVLINLIWRLASQRQALPCPSWLGWMVELDNPFTRVNHAQFIVDHLGLEPGMRVLDAGCGPGRVTVPLARAVGPASGRLPQQKAQLQLSITSIPRCDNMKTS